MGKIKKIKFIKNFGIFKDFDWDSNVTDKHGNTLCFKNINIIYGRNYSGKTTLSRIIQSFENKELPSKFGKPEFEIELEDGTILTQDDVSESSLSIRVFNEDFISKYFRFFVDPDEAIEPFAVLGENVFIEKEIRELEEKLGKEEPEATGLYKELKEKENAVNKKKTSYNSASEKLEKQLQKKAIDREIGIKYHADKFGDQNYNITKLKNDIKKIKENHSLIISEDEKRKLEELIKEESKDEIQPLKTMDIDFNSLKSKVKSLVEKKVLKTEKIEELVKNAMLNKWVQEGKKLHEEYTLKVCAFCGNPISRERWLELERHFDEETKKLEKEIQKLIDLIEGKIEEIKDGFKVDKSIFYSKFHAEIDILIGEYKGKSELVIKELEKLKRQVEARKKDIINEKQFEDVEDHTEQLKEIYDKYEKIRQESNNYTNNLQKEQEAAKEKLRLKEAYDFIKTIDYDSKIEEINALKQEKERASDEYEKIKKEVEEIKKQIEAKKRIMKNEEEGARKVNQYLNNHFGHPYLSLRAIQEGEESTRGKQIKFKVFRGDEVAYNLSKGERNLLAFCYFIAKLGEIGIAPEQTIIWIDDPVSSLDSNHIFFIYSLLESEIVKKRNYKQLFITTHNLMFLKYLLRLGEDKIYLFVERKGKTSLINKMPKYLKEYVTEFIYLFEQIYRCAREEQTDDNYYIFYNFGNNARKFLEIYLFYKYPGIISDEEKYKKFFREEIPVYIANRLTNEMSHLAGGLERGEQPIYFEEIKKEAQKIVDRIEELDPEQYNSLLRSIGVADNDH